MQRRRTEEINEEGEKVVKVKKSQARAGRRCRGGLAMRSRATNDGSNGTEGHSPTQQCLAWQRQRPRPAA